MNIEGLRPDELVTLANAKSRLVDNETAEEFMRREAWNDFNEAVTELRNMSGDEFVTDNVTCPKKLGDPYGPSSPAGYILAELKGAVRLLIAGVQSELTSSIGMPGKLAGIMTLQAVVDEVEDHVGSSGEAYEAYMDVIDQK